MLDEPLGSLDASLREQLMIELREIIKSVGLTTVYVTHDQQEAYAVADKVAVMNAGRIEQIDTPEALYRQPETVFVARFLGLSNFATPDALPDDLLARISDSQEAMTQTLLLHPDGLHLSNDGLLSVRVCEKVFQGGRYRLRVRISDDVLLTFPGGFRGRCAADGRHGSDSGQARACDSAARYALRPHHDSIR